MVLSVLWSSDKKPYQRTPPTPTHTHSYPEWELWPPSQETSWLFVGCRMSSEKKSPCDAFSRESFKKQIPTQKWQYTNTGQVFLRFHSWLASRKISFQHQMGLNNEERNKIFCASPLPRPHSDTITWLTSPMNRIDSVKLLWLSIHFPVSR